MGQIVVKIQESGGSVDSYHNLPRKWTKILNGGESRLSALHKKGQIVVKIHTTPWFLDFHHNLPHISMEQKPLIQDNVPLLYLKLSYFSTPRRLFKLDYKAQLG